MKNGIAFLLLFLLACTMQVQAQVVADTTYQNILDSAQELASKRKYMQAIDLYLEALIISKETADAGGGLKKIVNNQTYTIRSKQKEIEKLDKVKAQIKKSLDSMQRELKTELSLHRETKAELTKLKGELKETDLNAELAFRKKSAPYEFVRIKGGVFKMGSKEYENDEKPEHEVALLDFYMMKKEVTQKMWMDVMGTPPAKGFQFKGDNRPAENVTWAEARAFCEKLSAILKKEVRLPTEAQWEYAARGGSKSKGYKYAGDNATKLVANFNTSQTLQVGTKKPNELGLHDMSGNVGEWCLDGYDAEYYKNSKLFSPELRTGDRRVFRGGSWFDKEADACRVTKRASTNPNTPMHYVGFRCVLIP